MGRCYSTLLKVIETWQAKDVEGVLAHMHEDII